MHVRRSICCGWAVILSFAAAVHAQLSYVDRSVGLRPPTMEGGDTELEFGDTDGDGHVDIASIGDHGSPYVGTDQHGIMIWFGEGTGNWSVYQSGDFGYGGIALGDVDGDGRIDVGYGMHHNYSGNDFGDQLLEVARGDGTGRNWTPWDDGLGSNGETWGMFGADFADVDNDGDLDLGSISFGCCAGLHVYLNNGNGTWAQSFGFTDGNSAAVFVFGEVNGDGLADFAAAHGNGTVYFGDGVGGFQLADGNLPTPTWRRGVSLGDVNDDGRDELAFVNSNGGIAVWRWLAPGSWQSLSGSLPGSGGFEFTQIADMNLDGHGDLVATASGEPGLLVVFAGDGAGTWQQVASVPTPNSCDTAAFRAGVDADHNGYPDIALVAEENCGWYGGTNRLRFFAETSSPSTVWVHPSCPRGGETFRAGSVQFVEWSAAVAPPGGSSMTLELSLAGSSGPWRMVAQDLPDNGRYQWRIPASLPASSRCYLRYTLSTGTGGATAITPDAFTIFGSPSVIPTVSRWGMIVLMLLVLIAGTLPGMRRRSLRARAFRSGLPDGPKGAADVATFLPPKRRLDRAAPFRR